MSCIKGTKQGPYRRLFPNRTRHSVKCQFPHQQPRTTSIRCSPPPPPSRPPKVERTQRGRRLAYSKAFPGSTKHKGRFLRLLFSKGIRHLSQGSAAQVSPSVVLCLRLRCTHRASASWSSRNLGGSPRMCHLNDRRQVTGRSVVWRAD